MAAGNFKSALAFTLIHEGGWVDNPADPGGATNQGITLSTLQKWRGDPNVTVDDLGTLMDDERDAIYQSYWDQVKSEALPLGVDLMMFDFCVNAGGRRASWTLQVIVGVVSDGVIGTKTLLAVNRFEVGTLIRRLAEGRSNFYKRLPTYSTFGRGWEARTEACKAAALAMLVPKV